MTSLTFQTFPVFTAGWPHLNMNNPCNPGVMLCGIRIVNNPFVFTDVTEKKNPFNSPVIRMAEGESCLIGSSSDSTYHSDGVGCVTKYD